VLVSLTEVCARKAIAFLAVSRAEDLEFAVFFIEKIRVRVIQQKNFRYFSAVKIAALSPVNDCRKFDTTGYSNLLFYR